MQVLANCSREKMLKLLGSARCQPLPTQRVGRARDVVV